MMWWHYVLAGLAGGFSVRHLLDSFFGTKAPAKSAPAAPAPATPTSPDLPDAPGAGSVLAQLLSSHLAQQLEEQAQAWLRGMVQRALTPATAGPPKV